ncbi:hypothetical protein PR202_ga27574 [Eleusine coracana subsp. coracana]|uniref:Uncharacterized protein n=1 Tax=Eleusine coracana subsp. coracana TaxID=191504 RepID=A0AAV5DGW4_ELECO|nr:hypothetical protein PR202_ga27574 [Eleusine coracana subsp. coracana]
MAPRRKSTSLAMSGGSSSSSGEERAAAARAEQPLRLRGVRKRPWGRLRGPGATVNYPDDPTPAAAASGRSSFPELSSETESSSSSPGDSPAVAAAAPPSLDLSLGLPTVLVSVAPALIQFLPLKAEHEQRVSGWCSSSSVVNDAAPAASLGLDLNLAWPAAKVVA